MYFKTKISESMFNYGGGGGGVNRTPLTSLGSRHFLLSKCQMTAFFRSFINVFVNLVINDTQDFKQNLTL